MVSVCTIIGKEREATRPGVTEVRVNQRERERERERERGGGGGGGRDGRQTGGRMDTADRKRDIKSG